ncbi:MAG: T9SS type A sorting domain-containing protein [Ignavibacteria bacterium]|nr:T9SS type A sorting domain-containing protein [Ignavibacteria bacterium]
MKACSLLIVAVLFFSVPGPAQTVETVVSGSTFNDGLALDSDGNVYAAEYLGTRITRITPDGSDSIWATGQSSPNGIAFGPEGDLYVPNNSGDNITTISPGGTQTTYATLDDPGAILVNDDGTLLVARYNVNDIVVVDTAGTVTTFLSGAPLNGPIGLVRSDDGTLYIGNFTDGKVFRYTDLEGFVEIGDLPSWLGFMTLSEDIIFATAYQTQRIYGVPLDGSGEFIFAGTGVQGGADGPVGSATFTNPNGIIATSTGDTLYISEYGPRRLRRITGVLAVTSVGTVNEVAQQIQLHQNYPNPFNPATEIRFSLPESGFVHLTIFDQLGQEIATLAEGVLEPGLHSRTWNASGLPSGVYYYRMTGNNFTATRKLLLMK